MLDEAKRTRIMPPQLKLSFKGDSRTRFANLDALSQSRIAALIKHYGNRSFPKPSGVDKQSIGVYRNLNLRHFHISQKHPDPVLKYLLKPGEFIIIAIDDHAAMFGPNAKLFLDSIKDLIPEHRIAA